MGSSKGMLIMFCIMIGAYMILVGVYSGYRKIHEWHLQRKSRRGSGYDHNSRGKKGD